MVYINPDEGVGKVPSLDTSGINLSQLSPRAHAVSFPSIDSSPRDGCVPRRAINGGRDSPRHFSDLERCVADTWTNSY